MHDRGAFEFHIVYTPGSVGYLSYFVESLVDWSDARFCLVSNACLPAEVEALQRQCDRHPRLTFRDLPWAQPVTHGVALGHLQASAGGEHFCFMDSDVFATGPFLEAIAAEAEVHSGVFSASPVWVKGSEEILPPDFRYVLGSFNRTADGLGLGTTYLAIYDNEMLTTVIGETGVDFEEYRWNRLPRDVQERLSAAGFARSGYDTAKVINLLSSLDGRSLRYVDEPRLCHIGGASFHIEQRRRPPTFRARLSSTLDTPVTRPVIERIKRRRALAGYRRTYDGAPKAEYEMNASQRLLHRNPTRRYFVLLMDALREGRALPALPDIDDAEIAAKLRRASGELIATYERYATGSGDVGGRPTAG